MQDEKTSKLWTLVELLVLSLMCLAATGCKTLDAIDKAIEEWEASQIPPVVTPDEPEPPLPPVPDPDYTPEADDLPEGVVWLHTDVSGWPITAALDVEIGRSIVYKSDKANVWPNADVEGGVNANPWVIANVGGKWYAATHEWMRKGQWSKGKHTVAGDHCKRTPLSGDWRPKSGETLYFGVSGLARSRVRNVQERTPFIKVIWP